MNLTQHNSPHIRSRDSNFSVMGDVVIALLFLYFMGFYFYGFRAVLLGLISAAACVLCDVGCVLLARRKPGIGDLSPVITGLMIPLLMPASIPVSVVLAADFFAILVAKQPFGGLGQNVFNPAVAGVAFSTVAWPAKMFAYPAPMETVHTLAAAAERLVNSPAYKMKMGGVPSYGFLDLLLGNYPGPMGATHILVLLACLLYLVVRRNGSGRMTLSFLGSAAAFALVFPRINGTRLESVLFELTSGVLLFMAIFLISDPTTSPKRESSKVIYGAITGVVVMLFRRLGGFEESACFALLLMNAFVWLIDMYSERRWSAERRKNLAGKTKAV